MHSNSCNDVIPLMLFLLQLSVKNCFIRGSVIRYVQLPAEEVDTGLLQDATRKELAQGKQQPAASAGSAAPTVTT